MINCSATAIPLRADDLHEYQAAKATWKKNTLPSDHRSSGAAAGGGGGAVSEASAALARKQLVQSRLGVSTK